MQYGRNRVLAALLGACLVYVCVLGVLRGGAREVEQYHNLYVVYTREAETADMYIERATHELAKEHRTRVVSSDGAEQIIVMGHGALRVSARAFEEEVRAVEKEIREFLGE